jgi:putative effector of murein hydrolase LrgA (UPF0299 family)
MVRGLLVLLVCQLVGEFVVTALGAPIPGPVAGMVLLLLVLRLWRPTARSAVVKASDDLLGHLQLLFVPAGAGVVAYLPLLLASWLPIVGGLVLGWLVALLATAGAGIAALSVESRLRRRAAARAGVR